MPLYEYLCEQCGRRTEVLQGFNDPPLTECPDCHGRLRKLVSAPAFQFKGSGWYLTDYARKDGGETNRETAAQGEAKPEGGESGAKSEAKAGSETSASSPPAPAKPKANE